MSRLYYAAVNASGDYVLDVTDGTAAGTDDILTSTQDFGPQSPYGFTSLDDDLIFAAADPTGHVGLWVTQGTQASAVEIVSSTQGSALLSPESMAVVGSYVLFEALDVDNDEALWSTAGSGGSTSILFEFDKPRDRFTSLGDFALAANSDIDGSAELWITNGTAAGTFLIDANASPSDFDDDFAIAKLGSLALFQAVDGTGQRGVYAVDAATGATQELLGGMQGLHALDPSNFTVAGNLAFFAAYDQNGQRGLFITNGAPGGTREIFGIASQAYPLNPEDITAVGDDVVFEGQDRSGAYSLYWSNGTGTRTREIVSGVPGQSSVSPSFTALGDIALFDAPDADGDIGLWVTDGMAAGTEEIESGEQGIYSLAPSAPTVIGGVAYFEATDFNWPRRDLGDQRRRHRRRRTGFRASRRLRAGSRRPDAFRRRTRLHRHGLQRSLRRLGREWHARRHGRGAVAGAGQVGHRAIHRRYFRGRSDRRRLQFERQVCGMVGRRRAGGQPGNLDLRAARHRRRRQSADRCARGFQRRRQLRRAVHQWRRSARHLGAQPYLDRRRRQPRRARRGRKCRRRWRSRRRGLLQHLLLERANGGDRAVAHVWNDDPRDVFHRHPGRRLARHRKRRLQRRRQDGPAVSRRQRRDRDWELDDHTIVGGGDIGNPGAGWTFVGTGDFNGDGKTDLLFENASGAYATWTLDEPDHRRRHAGDARLRLGPEGDRRLHRQRKQRSAVLQRQ